MTERYVTPSSGEIVITTAASAGGIEKRVSFSNLVIEQSFTGKMSVAKFETTEELTIGYRLYIYLDGRQIWAGMITSKTLKERELWSVEAVHLASLVYKKLLDKLSPYEFFYSYPEEIFMEIITSLFGSSTPPIPLRGWLRTGIVRPDKELDTSNVSGSDTDGYSLVWNLIVNRYGLPISSIALRSTSLSTYSDLNIMSDYGAATSGTILILEITETGLNEYEVTPTESSWTTIPTSPTRTFSKLRVVEFTQPPRNRSITLSSALDLQDTTNYTDLRILTYPNLGIVPYYNTDASTIRMLWPNDDKMALIFHNSSTSGSLLQSDEGSYAYYRDIEDSIAGSYVEEEFNVLAGEYQITLGGTEREHIKIYVDGTQVLPLTTTLGSDKVTDDSYTSEGNPDTNYGTAENLLVAYLSGDDKYTWIKFDISGLSYEPDDIIKAELNLYMYYRYYAEDIDIKPYHPDADWDEGSITWNSQPTYTDRGDPTRTTSYTERGSWCTWDITQTCKQWFGGSNTGVVLVPVSATGETSFGFNSSESTADTKPYLVLYTPTTTITLSKGRHTIKIEADSDYTGGAYVIIREKADTSIVSKEYDVDNLKLFLTQNKLTNLATIGVVEGSAPGAQDLTKLWFDEIWPNTAAEIVRYLSVKDRTLGDVISSFTQMGKLAGYLGDRPSVLSESHLETLNIIEGDVTNWAIEESIDNYVSRVKVYGNDSSVYGEASISNPIVERELTLTFPWVNTSEEAQRLAELILDRYSTVKEVGSITLAGIFPQFLQPRKVKIESDLFDSEEFVVTSTTIDFRNLTTKLEINIPLFAFVDWLKEVYERLNTAGSYECSAGGCQVTCQVECQTAAEAQSCSETCETSCQATCQVECQTVCETECQESCETTGCQTDCKLQNCDTQCQLQGCDSQCKLIGCDTDCKLIGCDTSCELGTTCETECKITGCDTNCEIGISCQTNLEPT